jgi:5-methylcytosine-specific restriction endonuclease McrA
MSRSWQGGSTRAWRRVRAAVLLRDRGTCQLQLPGCTGLATCVHHTRGRAVTGDDPGWLVASCAHCNLVVGEPQMNPRPRGGTQW